MGHFKSNRQFKSILSIKSITFFSKFKRQKKLFLTKFLNFGEILVCSQKSFRSLTADVWVCVCVKERERERERYREVERERGMEWGRKWSSTETSFQLLSPVLTSCFSPLSLSLAAPLSLSCSFSPSFSLTLHLRPKPNVIGLTPQSTYTFWSDLLQHLRHSSF